jgi:alpha-galactosidase
MNLSLNFPSQVGIRAGNPFRQYISISGNVEEISVEGLPQGLTFDQTKRLITGTLNNPGEHCVVIHVRGDGSEIHGHMQINCGEQILLTPPLGWSSWNYCGKNISDEQVREMARALVETGLIDYGYSYVNIDDGWQGQRCPDSLALQPNEKFPDMKDLCDYVHGLGLKIGIYSTPWCISYAGFTGGSADTPDGRIINPPGVGGGKRHGEYKFHEQDARQFAEWGFDYLKYDWNPIDIEHTRQMSDALRHCGRDIGFSLSNSAPFEYACEWARLSHVWRTTGDITDMFKHSQELPDWAHSVVQCGFMTADRWAPYVGPGHWADPDMLVVGNFGLGAELRESRMSATEQKVHLTQWAILAAPILLGCDIRLLQKEVLDLLRNEEVLAVNQDPLGRQARRVKTRGIRTALAWGKGGLYEGDYHECEVWSKMLADGSRAVALYNLSIDTRQEIGFAFTDIGLTGECEIRDLWGRKSLGAFRGGFSADIDPHDCLLIVVRNPPS